MASSYTEGKREIVHFLEQIKPKTVIDVGPGCGTYWAILNKRYGDWLGGNAKGWVDYTGERPKMTAIEAFYPYVSKYSLKDKYDDVIISDIRYFDWDKAPQPCDLIIFGDVLEHLTSLEACLVVSDAKEVAKNIIISLPIVHFPQGAIDGNPFEIHKEEDWTHERVLKAFGEPHEFVVGQSIGVYWFKT
jgi:hypothetical protein